MTTTGETSAAVPSPGSFNLEARGPLRNTPPWHRLAYIGQALPEALARLSTALNVRPGDTLVDYGCADVPYRRFFPADLEYLAADLQGNPAATVTLGADGRLPLGDEIADALLSTQVLEHVLDPGLYLQECARCVRPGGRMLLSTHGIMVHHPDPVDLWRWTGEGLRRVVSDAGFDIVEFEGVMGLAATGLQLVQDSVYHSLPRRLGSAFALLMQKLVAVADRVTSPQSKASNALVFALVAERRRP